MTERERWEAEVSDSDAEVAELTRRKAEIGVLLEASCEDQSPRRGGELQRAILEQLGECGVMGVSNIAFRLITTRQNVYSALILMIEKGLVERVGSGKYRLTGQAPQAPRFM